MTPQRTRVNRQRRTASRRLGILPGRRLAVLIVLAAGLLGCLASAASADESIATAIIVKPGEQSPSEVAPVSLSTLLATPACVPYSNTTSTLTTVAPSSSQSLSTSSDTWPIYTILACGLGQTLSAGDWVQIQDPSTGPEAPLFYSAGDLTTPSDFQDPGQVPLIIAEPGENVLQYYRPQRRPDGGVTDENAYDFFQVNPGPITIWVDEGGSPPLSVAITGVPAGGVTAGATVSLTAAENSNGATLPDPANLSYSWTSNDSVQFSNDGAGQAVQATLGAAGEAEVTVEVQDNQDGTFGFANARITVGAPGSDATSATPNSSNGQTSQPSAPATGPKQSNGSATGGTAEPRRHSAPVAPGAGSGQSSGAPATAKPRPAPKSESAPSSATTGASSTKAAPTDSGHPAPSSSPQAVSGSAGAAAHASQPPGHAARPSARLTRPPTASPTHMAATTRQTRVTGRLIEGVTVLPAAASPLVYAVPPTIATAAPVRRGAVASALPALAAGLVVTLLFSLGAGRELRWRRRLGARLHGS